MTRTILDRDGEIVRRLAAGESQRAVAADHGLNPVTVGRVGKRAGLTFPRGAKSAEARRGKPIRQTERAFQAQVIELARLCGWRVHHQWSAVHSPAGWPDLVLCRPPRLVIAELKAEDGVLTPAQETWIALLRACPGVETFVWRPSDWDEISRTLR